MSRNLGETSCHFCDHPVVMTGEPRPFDYTSSEWFEEFKTLTVRDAECPVCLAQYLAWVSQVATLPQPRLCNGTHFDLSFRHSFNDEPSDRDMPRYKVRTRVIYERIGPFDDHVYLDLGEYKEPKL